jgi:plastocyanin
LIGLAVLGLIASGCSTKKDTSEESGTKAPPVTLTGTVNNHGTKDLSKAGGSATVSVEQDNYYFEPTFIKGSPGEVITLQLKNEGSVQHSFTVDSLNIEKVVSPDGKDTVQVTLPSSGVVVFHCKFHFSQGMQGAFYFHEGDSVSAGGPAPAGASPAGGSSSPAGGGYSPGY